ncbi:hypothetical protein [Adhaeretor mobilis]|uniref:Flagellar protein FliL n=1 Tax=Adhaeretor mobilis TaxID=1930276 RepID=A0A517MYT1_9BACT|nr:hypothetical protein [Adhaeretor mobilis]QDT00042.1 hypothetical protein HG15A2_33770 [Adhaeretor mobilis]
MADEIVQPEEAAPAKSGGLMTIIKAVACISIVVLLEMAAASMLIPDAEATQAIGEELAAAKADDEKDQDAELEGDRSSEDSPLGNMVEVNLGAYHIRHTSPETGTSLNIDFDLWGTVLADEATEFDDLYTTNQQRISEQVTITIRGMDVSDFSDPNLDLIKRKILEKTNRALGKPLLHDALIVEFSFLER